MLSTNEKGGIAETAIAAAATKLGVSVLRPIVEHGRYDLAFEIGERLLRVQCKWGQLDDTGAVVRVALKSNRLTPAGTSSGPTQQTRSTYLRSTAPSSTAATFFRSSW